MFGKGFGHWDLRALASWAFASLGMLVTLGTSGQCTFSLRGSVVVRRHPACLQVSVGASCRSCAQALGDNTMPSLEPKQLLWQSGIWKTLWHLSWKSSGWRSQNRRNIKAQTTTTGSGSALVSGSGLPCLDQELLRGSVHGLAPFSFRAED